MTATLAAAALRLRELHDTRPLVLPNVWDAASALAYQKAGFPALATSSAAVAAALGYEDHEAMPVDEAFAAVARIAAAIAVPLTADIESGYGLPPAEVARRLLDAGAVGCNLEDTDHATGGLVDAAQQAARLALVVETARTAGVELLVNARVDTYARGAGDSDDERLVLTTERAKAYLDAGAACIYPILATGEETLAALVKAIPGPVNALYLPGGPSIERIGEIGVARITFGSGLHRFAMASVRRVATHLAAGGDPYEPLEQTS